jgi:hypothetical protein
MRRNTIYFLMLLVLNSCGPENPSKKMFYSLTESQAYRFMPDGTVEAWTYDGGSKYAIKTCSCEGTWRITDDLVIVEGLNNPNCPEMVNRNGRFELDGDNLVRK